MSAFQDPEIYRDILDGLQVGVSVIDLEHKIVFWSDGAEEITGYARFEVLGRNCSENILLHCNQKHCELCDETCPITGALQELKPFEAAGFIHHKSGHRTPVHTWAIPLHGKDGSVIGIIQTFDEFSPHSHDPKQYSLKQRGWLDDATGLPNQAIMFSHLRDTLGSFTDFQVPFSIAVLAFPDFDQFRARYGHGAARSLLQVLARTLRNSLWPTDFVGCWHDGQFLAILPGCDHESLPPVANRLQHMMAGATIMWWGEELSSPVALGCASARSGDNMDSILQRAQKLLSDSQSPSAMHAAAGANHAPGEDS